MQWLDGIQSDKQHEEILAAIDELIEDYDENRVLLDTLFQMLDEYENNSEHYQTFNLRQNTLEPGVATLQLLIDQHNLTVGDFQQEIGSQSLVSRILSGKSLLNSKHVRTLSKRFALPIQLFE
jgi:HTH-type transcriptional regulator/antitoxin HigA